MNESESAPKDLLPGERLLVLQGRLSEFGRVRVDESAAMLGVSSETVRRYLKQLAAAGKARLIRGGAVATEDMPARPLPLLPPIDHRAQLNQSQKEAIGRKSADLVGDGSTVLLDGGSTTLSVARHLCGRERLTVITNNLMIAQLGVTCPGWRVHVIGGELSPSSASLVGPAAIRDLEHAAADIVFLGAAGVSAAKGFTSVGPFESELKRAMMATTRRVAVVADHSKLKMSGVNTFATPSEVHYFVTSDGADEECFERMRKAGVDVLTAG